MTTLSETLWNTSDVVGCTAFDLDMELRFLCGAHDLVQRTIGQGLNRLFSGDLLMLLSSARRADYVRERLGISLRQAQELARIESLIVDYPETDRLWRAGRISRCHVREILCRAPADEDFGWARCATIMSVRKLVDLMGQNGLKPLSGRGSDSQRGTVLEFDASPELRVCWDAGMEINNRIHGADVGAASFLESCCAEWRAEVPLEIYDVACIELAPPGWGFPDEDDIYEAEQQRKMEAETQCWASLRRESGDVAAASVPDLSIPENADAYTIDECLRAALKFDQEVDCLLMTRLWQAERIGIHKQLQFASLVHYAAERLGMGATKLKSLLRSKRVLARSDDVAEAYAFGELTLAQAELVVRVGTAPTMAEWIAYARNTTVRKLRAEVQAGVRARREHPVRYQHMRPPELQCTSDPKALALLESALAKIPRTDSLAHRTCACSGQSGNKPVCEELISGVDKGVITEQPTVDSPLSDHTVQRPGDDRLNQSPQCACSLVAAAGVNNCGDLTPPGAAYGANDGAPSNAPSLTHPANDGAGIYPRVSDVDVSDVAPGRKKIRLTIPGELTDFVRDTLGLCRTWLGGKASVGQCIEALVGSFMREYWPVAKAEAKKHKLVERDGWQCTVPGCGCKGNIDLHHVQFKSQGGSNANDNQTSACESHHLRGIHMGLMKVAGSAPNDLVWELGIRPDGTPTQVFVGDTLLYSRC